jgi:hypothetical protein
MSRSHDARAPTHNNSKQQLRQTPKRTAKQTTSALNLNAFSVPLINLMSHSDGNPANNTLRKEARAQKDFRQKDYLFNV